MVVASKILEMQSRLSFVDYKSTMSEVKNIARLSKKDYKSTMSEVKNIARLSKTDYLVSLV